MSNIHSAAAGPSLALQRAHEREIIDQVRQRDAYGDFRACIVVERAGPERRTVLHFVNPYLEQPPITSLPTTVTREQAERVVSQIIPTRESCDILCFLAECYSMRLPALIEGPTALGKTYLIKKFNELLYGEGVAPLDFYCSGQTDVSELMARWVPKTSNREELKRWEDFLSSASGQARLNELVPTSTEESEMSSGESVISALQTLAREVGLSSQTQWELQLGAVPKAMLGTFTADGHFRSDEHNPRGCILHIEEVGLARPPVVNALLKIRGEFGRLAHHIDLWEDGGRKITAGPDFWIVMSTNPPEDYGSREPVDQALARGVVFKRCAQIDKSSYLMMARRYFSFGLGNRPNVLPQSTILPYFRHPELCNEVAELMADFHAQAVEQCRGGESGRAQRIPVTLDDMARVAAFMLSCQSRDSTTGQFNVVHTLQRAVERMYLGRLLSESRDERGANVLIEAGARQATKSNIALSTKLQALFEQLLLGETGVKVFEQKKLCRAEILKILVSRAHESEERRKVQGVLSPAEELEFRRSRLQLEGDQQIDLTVQLLSRRGAAVAVGDSPQGSSH